MRYFLIGLLAMAMAGCTGGLLTDDQGHLDIERVQGLVQALDDAGFVGTLDLDSGDGVEAGLKEAVYLRTPGAGLVIHGELRPDVEDE